MIFPNHEERLWRRSNGIAAAMTVAVCSVSLLASPLQNAGSNSTSQRQKNERTSVLIGRVTAISASAIAGASISLRSIADGQESTTATNAEGAFRFKEVQPGEYRLEVTAPGYKTFVVEHLPLVAGDVASANAVLERGRQSDVVAGASESVISRAGTALAGKSVSDLPENQRNFVNAVQVSAGANEGSTNTAANGSRPGAQHESSAVSIGGEPETSNFSMIEGIDNNERLNSKIAIHPSVEGIDGVEIFASAYPASMGQAAGGFINVRTKSGKDAVHGSVYEYFRNDRLDAFPFQFGARNAKPELRQNQFGASVGGPLIRMKTNYFFDYEAFRLIQGRAPVALTVPTAYEHEHPGDFSDVGGPVLSKLDPVGLAYFRLYPLPNVAGTADQFVSAPSGSNFSHIADARIDQHFSSRNQLFARSSFNRTLVSIPGQFPTVEEAGLTIEPGGSLTSYAGHMRDVGVNSMIGWRYEVFPTLAVELRGGYLYWREADTSLNPNVAVNSAFGQPGVNVPVAGNGLAPVDVFSASPLGGDGFWRPLKQSDRTLQLSGTVDWDRKAHSITTGATLVRRQWSDIGSADGLGLWKFEDLPSLLEGKFVGLDREVDLIEPHLRTWEWSVFLQDSWKLAPSLTVNVGLRYDLLSPPTEAQNRLANFDFSTGRIVIAGRDGVSDTAGIRTDHSNVGPRVGFSWNAGLGLLLRGGYGLVYQRPLDTFDYKMQPYASTFGVCTSLTCPGGFTSLAAGLPDPVAPDPRNPTGDLWNTRSFNERMLQVHQFNLGLEKEFAGNTARVYYVGSLVHHRARFFPDYNAPPPNTSSDPDSLRPYHNLVPNITAIDYTDTEGASSYHAMQATLAHDMRRGLTAHINYTWAHGLDNDSGQGFGTVPSMSSTLDYGNSSFDVRQRAVATLFYELPFGRNSTGVRRIAFQGWQANLAGVWSTGLPFTVLNASDVSNTNPGASAADRSNQLGPGKLAHPSVSKYFNVDAFAAQAPGTLGNERSNQLYGPSTRHLDASLFKNFSLHNERNVQFRTEIFNLTNTANFASPSAVLGGGNFGHLTQLTAGYTPREIQIALRLQF